MRFRIVTYACIREAYTKWVPKWLCNYFIQIMNVFECNGANIIFMNWKMFYSNWLLLGSGGHGLPLHGRATVLSLILQYCQLQREGKKHLRNGPLLDPQNWATNKSPGHFVPISSYRSLRDITNSLKLQVKTPLFFILYLAQLYTLQNQYKIVQSCFMGLFLFLHSAFFNAFLAGWLLPTRLKM